jgi:hypothetical protein
MLCSCLLTDVLTVGVEELDKDGHSTTLNNHLGVL